MTPVTGFDRPPASAYPIDWLPSLTSHRKIGFPAYFSPIKRFWILVRDDCFAAPCATSDLGKKKPGTSRVF